MNLTISICTCNLEKGKSISDFGVCIFIYLYILFQTIVLCFIKRNKKG